LRKKKWQHHDIRLRKGKKREVGCAMGFGGEEEVQGFFSEKKL